MAGENGVRFPASSQRKHETMRRDKNIVILSGVSGDDVKFGRAQNGKEYVTFTLLCTQFDRKLGDDDEHVRCTDFLRIMVFNNPRKRLVDYLKTAGFRRGMRVMIFGRLQAHKTEFKGNPIIQINVNVRNIHVYDKRGHKIINNKEKE